MQLAAFRRRRLTPQLDRPWRSAAAVSVVVTVMSMLVLIAACSTIQAGEPVLPGDSYSIWPETTDPKTPSTADTSSVELGLQFSVTSPGLITAIRFYRSESNQGPHHGRLWSPDGAVMADVDFDAVPATGWQAALLPKAVPVEPGGTYTASYSAPVGHYAADHDSLGGGKVVVNRDLHALRGVYSEGDGVPRESFRNTNYYVDVLFSPTVHSATTAPAPSASTASGGTPDTAGTTRTMSSFPSMSSTGSKATSARRIDGDYHVTTPGALVENLDIRGSLFVDARDVTVRNVRVTCSTSWWVVQAKAPGVTIQDSTLTVDNSNRSNYCQYGIVAGDRARILRNDISRTPDGLSFVGDSAYVEGNWIHEQIAYDGKEDHVDAAQLNGGGAGPYVFKGNHFSVPGNQTGCLALFADFGPINNVLADGNLFDGGGYAVYGGTATASNVRFTNNWFATSFHRKGGFWGAVTRFSEAGKGNEWRNNRWLHSGRLVEPIY